MAVEPHATPASYSARETTGERRPGVVVVLLNWNNRDDTLTCVHSLERMSYPNYTIAIVDNGSEGDDVAVLRSEAGERAHIIENGANLGFSEGNNVGARYALETDAEYVLILNNDTVVGPDLLSRLVSVMEADPSVGVAAPWIYLVDRPENIVYPRQVDRLPVMLQFHLTSHGLFNSWTIPRRSTPLDVRFVDGCCFLIRRALLERTGLFDGAYFFGGYESACLSRRALRLCYRLVAVPDARVWAKVAGSWGSARRAALAYAYGSPRNRVIFARKQLSLPHYALFLATLPAYTALWVALFTMRARSLRGAAAVLRGLRDGFLHRCEPTVTTDSDRRD